VHEKFTIAFGTKDWGIDDLNRSGSQGIDAGGHAFDSKTMSRGIADDSALADVLATGFELRLDEDDGFKWRRSLERCPVSRPGGAYNGWQQEGRGDEGDIHREEADAGGQITGDEIARVGALHECDARVAAKLVGDLSIAGVDGEDAGGSVLEHAVGEASGRGSDVQAEASGEVDVPMAQRGFELESATADVAEVVAENAERSAVGNGMTGLVEFLLVDKDAASEDERLGALASRSESALNEEFVEPYFHGVGHLGSGRGMMKAIKTTATKSYPAS